MNCILCRIVFKVAFAIGVVALNLGCVFSGEKQSLVSNYSTQVYSVSTATYHHGACEISILQVSPRTQTKNSDQIYGCRVWINVLRSSTAVFEKYFSDIDASGASYGVFVASSQPSLRYFAFLKLGDYDGRIFILDENCVVTSAVGGKYFVTADKRYLFSVYASDVSGLTVFDYATGKVIYEQNGINGINHFFAWYTDGVRYFATEAIPAIKGYGASENRGHIYVFSFEKKKLIKQNATKVTFVGAQKIRYLFDPKSTGLTNCCSGPGGQRVR